jgi:ABC-2 type transport system permease protein
MLYLLWLEIVRMLRDPKYLALAVGAPIGFYLLFSTLFGGGHTSRGQLPGVVEIAVAMAAFGAVWSAISTTGPRLAEERQIGWIEQLRSMPIPGWKMLTAKLIASFVTSLPAIVLVCLTAILVKSASLSVGQWVSLIVAIWLGSLTFAALGILLGLALPSQLAFPASYGLYLASSALGGLWVPPAVMPAGMKDVAVWLPTYHLANLGWAIADGNVPPILSVLNLVGWTALFAVGALIIFRRPLSRS